MSVLEPLKSFLVNKTNGLNVLGVFLEKAWSNII